MLLIENNVEHGGLMNEVERLKQWMHEQSHTITSLAQAVGMSYDGVYQVLNPRNRHDAVSPGFQVRFIHAFGLNEANRIFDAPQVRLSEPLPRGGTRIPQPTP